MARQQSCQGWCDGDRERDMVGTTPGVKGLCCVPLIKGFTAASGTGKQFSAVGTGEGTTKTTQCNVQHHTTDNISSTNETA